jgi:hypothetical protein
MCLNEDGVFIGGTPSTISSSIIIGNGILDGIVENLK